MPDPRRTLRGLSARSLVSRLLLAAVPVAVVVVLLVGFVAAPLLRTPSDLARAEMDLVEVQRYQTLLTLVDQQSLHWAEYHYLPRAQLGTVRTELGDTKSRILALQQDWTNQPLSARAAFAAYDDADRAAQINLSNVDAGRDDAALRRLTGEVLPLTHRLTLDLEARLLERSERLAQTFAELAGNVEVSFVGTSLADDLTTVRSEITHLLGVTAIKGLLIREASEYAQLIATGGSPDVGAGGASTLVERELARLADVADVDAGSNREEQRTLAALSRYHTELSKVGGHAQDLSSSGQRAKAAQLFEARVDPILVDELLPRVVAQVANDQWQLRAQIAAVDARTRRLRAEIAAGGILLLLVLLSPIGLIGRSTVRPLRNIRRAADEVRAGNLAARTGVDERSEVGELALAFDAMTARVEESRASLMSTSVLEASSDLLLIVHDAVVSYASGACHAMLGRTPESIVGEQITTLLHPEDVEFLHGWAEERTLDSVVVEARRAGAAGWVDTKIAVVDLRSDPQVLGVALNIRDVTERKLAEVALAEARDAAVEGSRLKSSFLATMSHEIRTPMNGVIGLTGLLLTTELDARQTQYARGVQTAGEALLAIINDILDFSKVEAGKLALEEIDFNLVQVVEDAAVLVADAAQQKNVELLAYCSPDLPLMVRGDPSRLRQVLLNLVSNAVKFTEHGEVVVRGHREDHGAEGLLVRFEVSDTGLGIPAASRHLLFDPFTQADSSTTREFGGTGLGLAISHRLVTAMGGEIGVDSEVGRGSTFWFTLPLRLAVAQTAATRPAPGPLGGLRALIVDDNATNRMILTDQLGAWGIRSDAVESGDRALGALRVAAGIGDAYDMALLDYCMPHMDGLDLAGQISRDPALSDTGLLLLTSAAEVGGAGVTAAGITETLTKPVRLSELHAALQNLARPAQQPEHSRGPVAAVIPTRGHLLVVEDNETNQLVAVGILEGLGFSVQVVSNGVEALRALQAPACGEFDAVLMDCQMPVMDGFTATGEIRRAESPQQHLPIIAMTAGAIDGDRDRCLEAGMDDYVSKPVSPLALDLALTQCLAARPRVRTTPEP